MFGSLSSESVVSLSTLPFVPPKINCIPFSYPLPPLFAFFFFLSHTYVIRLLIFILLLFIQRFDGARTPLFQERIPWLPPHSSSNLHHRRPRRGDALIAVVWCGGMNASSCDFHPAFLLFIFFLRLRKVHALRSTRLSSSLGSVAPVASNKAPLLHPRQTVPLFAQLSRRGIY
ncbi:unnamed protein product [Chondrus crispus]|uniref:Uncharacterized protein n=1 Tax=Chondrus crispus TaxID=2769 RepID=R7QMS4_CHOCR|nr:unnamed protein product [Chondrus crispus]CDF38685.1 unnamed protein product [Chondrus crispus]|eukprot:XP_005718590.1 unnamed protein product [Chondrus crispus]